MHRRNFPTSRRRYTYIVCSNIFKELDSIFFYFSLQPINRYDRNNSKIDQHPAVEISLTNNDFEIEIMLFIFHGFNISADFPNG